MNKTLIQTNNRVRSLLFKIEDSSVHSNKLDQQIKVSTSPSKAPPAWNNQIVKMKITFPLPLINFKSKYQSKC